MKKIIVLMMMMLVASVGYGKKYKDNVASRIIMTVNTNGIRMKGANEFICNLRKNGIKPHVRLKISGDEDWMVKIGDNEFKTLDEAGVSPAIVQRALGHSKITTTQQFYTHLTTESVIENIKGVI